MLRTITRSALHALTASTLVIMGSISVFSVMHAIGSSPELPLIYQGRLTDSTYLPITDGARPMMFALYDAPTGGTCYWTTGDGSPSCAGPDAINVAINGGLFTVPLGNGDTNNPELGLTRSNFDWGTASRFLEIKVWNGASFETLSPRTPLGGSYYAYNSALFDGYFSGDFIFGQGKAGGQMLFGGTEDGDELQISATTGVGGKINIFNDKVSIGFVDYTWPSANAGGILTNDGAGILTWAAGGGGGVNTDGDDNTWAGIDAFLTPTAGMAYENTAFGYRAMNATTEGNYSAAFGAYTLENNTLGYNNTAIGAEALKNNTEGYQNVAIGSGAMWQNTIGSYNTAVGDNALSAPNDNEYNTAVGYRAGDLAKGSYNTIMGSEAFITNDFSYTSDKNVVLGYRALNTGSSSVVSSSVIIGAEAADSFISPGDRVIVIGGQAGQNGIGFNSIMIGTGTGTGGAAQNSITIGSDSSGAAENSIAIGNEIGYSGPETTLVGYQAIKNGTSQYGNTAVGYQALLNTTNGGYNTAIGRQALSDNETGQYNIAIGPNALTSATSGSSNIGIGESAWVGNGNYNIAIGHNANASGGDGMSDGSYNLAIGLNTSIVGSSLSYTTVLGYGAQAYEGNTMILGGAAGSGYEVNVGIGTSYPHSTLQIEGSLALKARNVVGPDSFGNKDYIVGVSTSFGAYTQTLPDAAGAQGRMYVVKDEEGNAGTNNITIDSAGGLIDGAATQTINTNWGSMRFYANNGNWFTY